MRASSKTKQKKVATKVAKLNYKVSIPKISTLV